MTSGHIEYILAVRMTQHSAFAMLEISLERHTCHNYIVRFFLHHACRSKSDALTPANIGRAA